MNLHWDKRYVKIALHGVAALLAAYIGTKLIDAAAVAVTNTADVSGGGTLNNLLSAASPVIIAFVIAYLLDPIVDFFQRKYETLYENKLKLALEKLRTPKRKKENCADEFKKRTAGALFTYVIIILVLYISLRTAFIKIGSGGGSFSAGAIDYIHSTVNSFRETYARAYILLEEWGALDYVSDYLTSFINELTTFVQGSANHLVASITSIGNGLFKFLLAMIIAFYFLKDKAALLYKLDKLFSIILPKKMYLWIKGFLEDTDHVFSNYIRGQIMDGMIVAVAVSILLSIFGIKFAIIIGIISGVANLIPYFGSTIAFILAMLAALLSGDPMKALYSGICILIFQQIDGLFIGPKIIGSSVKISPMLVIISLSIAGSLFGFTGMILAVPVCAICKLFLERFLDKNSVQE